MAIRRTWTLELNDGRHVVEIEHGHWSGYRTIMVDGEQIDKSRNFASPDDHYHFDVSGHPCILRVRPGILGILFGIGFVFELTLDGKSI